MKLASTTNRIFTLSLAPAAIFGIMYVESAFQSPALPVIADVFIAVLKFKPAGTLSLISVFTASCVPSLVTVMVKTTVSPAFTVALCPAAKVLSSDKSKGCSTLPGSSSSSSSDGSSLSGVESESSPESFEISAILVKLVPVKLESTTNRIFTLSLAPAAIFGIM